MVQDLFFDFIVFSFVNVIIAGIWFLSICPRICGKFYNEYRPPCLYHFRGHPTVMAADLDRSQSGPAQSLCHRVSALVQVSREDVAVLHYLLL